MKRTTIKAILATRLLREIEDDLDPAGEAEDTPFLPAMDGT